MIGCRNLQTTGMSRHRISTDQQSVSSFRGNHKVRDSEKEIPAFVLAGIYISDLRLCGQLTFVLI